MRIIISAAIVAAISICALAQEKLEPLTSHSAILPKAEGKKEPPVEVVIDAATAQKLENVALKARNAQLEADSLEAQIRTAAEALKTRREEAQKLASESNAAFQRAMIKAGVPGDNIKEYQGGLQADGTLKMTRKPPQPSTPDQPKP